MPKSKFSLRQRHDLACQILREIDPATGLTSAARRKLNTFLELTSDVGLSKEGRALSGSLSSIIGHLDDRPLAVTRRLVLELLKGSDPHDQA